MTTDPTCQGITASLRRLDWSPGRGGEARQGTRSPAFTHSRMTKKKTLPHTAEPAKSTAKTPELIPQPHGGALNSGGTPGNKGGRPTNEWKRHMAELADKWAQAAEAQRVLDDPDHPQWMRAGQFAAEQAHGKAAQPITGDQDAPLIIRVVRE